MERFVQISIEEYDTLKSEIVNKEYMIENYFKQMCIAQQKITRLQRELEYEVSLCKHFEYKYNKYKKLNLFQRIFNRF